MKVKNENDFFYLSEGMENCKMSEMNQESRGILRWMISGNPDRSKPDFVQVKITLISEKRKGRFFRVVVVIRINMVPDIKLEH